MKSIGVTLQRAYLTKNSKNKLCVTSSLTFLLFNIILNNFITLQIKKQSPIGVLQKMYSANMQQTYSRTPMRKYDFSNVANQLF